MEMNGEMGPSRTSTAGTKRSNEKSEESDTRESDDCRPSRSPPLLQPRKHKKTSQASSKYAAKTTTAIQYRTGVHVVTMPSTCPSLNWHNAVTGDVRTISLKSTIHKFMVDSSCSRVAALLGTRNGGLIRVHSLESGEQLSEIVLSPTVDRRTCWDLAFSNDGKTLVYWGKKDLVLHNVDDSTQVVIKEGFHGRHAKFSPDDAGLYLVDCDDYDDDRNFGVWKMEIGDDSREMTFMVPLAYSFCALAVATAKPFGVVVDEKYLTVWNAVTSAVEFSALHELMPRSSMSVQIGDEDTKILIGSRGGLSVWGNTSIGEAEWTQIWSIPSALGVIFCVCGSVTMYTCSFPMCNADKQICVVDSATGEELDRLPPFVSRVGGIVYQNASVILL